MRINHEKMIEILKAYEDNGSFFVQIGKYFDGSQHIYQFGVSELGYNTIKRIFQSRPFDNLSQSSYRYFWHYGCGNDVDFYLDIQFEQDQNIKSYPIKADQKLVSNLKWFIEIKNFEEIKHLEIKSLNNINNT